MIRRSDINLYTHYVALLVDAQTLTPVLVMTATTSPKFEGARSHKVDIALRTDKAEDMTPEKAAQLREALVPFLTDSVGEVLLRMGLTGMVVADDFADPPVQTPAAPVAPTL